jgi:hypothetical protein
MSCSQFCRQFKVLAWKNAILKCRNWITLLIEILVPTVIIIALGGVKLAIPANMVSKNYPSTYRSSGSLESLYSYNAPTCRDQNLVYNCLGKRTCESDLAGAFLLQCQERKIAVAPASSSNMAASSAATAFISFAQNVSATAQSRSTFTYFASEGDFLSYIQSSDYSTDPAISIYSSAIIFNQGNLRS